MRALIQKVLEAEAEARRLVAAARSGAERTVSEARTRADVLRSNARTEAQQEAREIIRLAVECAEHEKHNRLAAEAARIGSEIQLNSQRTDELVEAGVRAVCGSES